MPDGAEFDSRIFVLNRRVVRIDLLEHELSDLNPSKSGLMEGPDQISALSSPSLLRGWT